jgi:hypothetical protein
MPADKPDWGGARENTGPKPGAANTTTTERNGLVRRVANMEAQFADRDRLDASGQKTPKAISVMRLRMNFHMWQVSIFQKRLLAPGAAKLPAQDNKADLDRYRQYERDRAEMERHLQLADDAAGRIVKYETPALATVKNIGKDDDFDQDLSELPDDGLAELARSIQPVVADPAQSDIGAASQHGAADDGGPAAPVGQGPGGTAAPG